MVLNVNYLFYYTKLTKIESSLKPPNKTKRSRKEFKIAIKIQDHRVSNNNVLYIP